MDFQKLEQRFKNGEKPKLFFKDGTNVFTYNPPLKLYPKILEQEPSIDLYTEPDGSNPLFYVDSIKKFDYLVEYGFDIYAVDNEGYGLPDVLDVSIFKNLNNKVLKEFGGSTKDKDFLKMLENISDDEDDDDDDEDEHEVFGGSLTLFKKMIGHDPDSNNGSVHSPHDESYQWSFYTDANNQYKFFTTSEGYGMLKDLATTLEPVFSNLRKQKGFNEEEGFRIYTQKENIKSGATWSDEEYANPSFIYQYCLNKAMQRFPESIEMMNSAWHLGVLNKFKESKNITVVSLGGGCSYELLAVKTIFNKYLPNVKLRLVSMDYEPFWGEIVSPLGIEFEQIDFNKPVDELEKQLSKYNADFYVMSFVYITYIRERHREFIRYLAKSSFGIFINDRNDRQGEYLTFDIMDYKLSKNGYLTFISDAFEGYDYVNNLTSRKGVFPENIYKDTPWGKVAKKHVPKHSGKKY